MVGDVGTSIIRTIVPIVAGTVITFLASKGITFDEQLHNELLGLLQAVFTALYYLIVRFLERYSAKFGWLLGSPKQPEYTAPDDL